MNDNLSERLRFLRRVVERELHHLRYSSGSVFGSPMTRERAAKLGEDEALAERVEAYTSRFCRLQDTTGDKLLPLWLRALGEKTGAVVDNLDRAEKLGVLASADQWLTIRQIRNQMIHEYIESAEVLADALNTAHDYEETLIAFANAMLADVQRRGI
ncbi:hypothetical protein SAMN05192555_10168 [Franzmannia pantelleriensis]|uniref:Nucleotidyltransferase substrate binding protein, HI0074 family n=1 Tax=Franzmannia pantelleriensis TaxID=48727 RepID=A0A1G9ECZ9_9GAMM|nr:hypothetical protein [Halomonas pantelleriensis]SDK73915.1 hypothetical protein SAMN05192555_10168 [Halomonas pantelleriensis]